MRSGSDGGEEGTTSTGGGDDPEKSPRRRSSWHPSTSRAVSPSSQVRARHRDGDLRSTCAATSSRSTAAATTRWP
jgi:hypothetical protein